MSGFDPNAASLPDSGIFGLPRQSGHGIPCGDEADVQLVPVPFAATVSYGEGAESGPELMLAASRQVDLFDRQTGRPYERGIFLRDADPQFESLGRQARALAVPIIQRGGASSGDVDGVRQVDAAGVAIRDALFAVTAEILRDGKMPGILGGDHSVPLGAMAAAAAAHPGLGVLQVDAHADLRPGFEGFRYSHASIIHNLLTEVSDVARVVQVGVRDLCQQEMDAITHSQGRVVTHFDMDWRRRLAGGEATWLSLCREAVNALPAEVWITFDIDGLDPSLCPNTGTPVPGGLGFAEACMLLESVVESGRRIVGFDLVEVAASPSQAGAVPVDGEDPWDAVVGARLLYKLIGNGLLTR